MTGIALGLLVFGNATVACAALRTWRTGRTASKGSRAIASHLGSVLLLVALIAGGVYLLERLPKGGAVPSAWLVGIHASAVVGTIIVFGSIVLERAHAWWRRKLYLPGRKDLHWDFVRLFLVLLPIACVSGSLILVEIN
jgi:hypothetical protein